MPVDSADNAGQTTMRPGRTRDAAPKGQGLIEYALIVVLVALVVIVGLRLFGTGVGGLFSAANAAF